MKHKFAIAMIIIFSFFMLLPSSGQAWHHGYPVRYHGHAHFYGWIPAAIIAGTFITGAIILGATQERTRPSYQPPPAAYTGPGPTVYYPPSGQPYAAPDPEFMAKYDKKDVPGEWVSVPGQWVGDAWVPQHRVFVPVNP